jgi:hypothetical protein
MNIEDLTKYSRDMINRYPGLEDGINDFYFLAIQEIDSGESQNNECELAVSSIEQLIQEL